MNSIGQFIEKPNAYFIGKYHENWAAQIFEKHSDSEVVSKWTNSLYTSQPQAFSVVYPESHIEKSDFFISAKIKKDNGMSQMVLDGISAKCGTTSMHGQIYRGSLKTIKGLGFISDDLYESHQEWLSQKQDLNNVSNIEGWKNWYSSHWESLLNKLLFGIKSQASSLLMSNLNYCEDKKTLDVVSSVVVTKSQALEDLKTLSAKDNVYIDLKGRGKIKSGIVSIQRAGGSNGGVGAEDWQARIDRNAYIEWLKEERPNAVWCR